VRPMHSKRSLTPRRPLSPRRQVGHEYQGVGDLEGRQYRAQGRLVTSLLGRAWSVLTMAEEQEAYTLSDRPAYLARTVKGSSWISWSRRQDPCSTLCVITVNPAKNPKINADLANKFLNGLSLPTQEKLQAYGVPGVELAPLLCRFRPVEGGQGTAPRPSRRCSCRRRSQVHCKVATPS